MAGRQDARSELIGMSYDEPTQLPPEFRQQPLTARILEDFAVCPRKFLLGFFVGRDEDRRFRGGPAALHVAVREALVDWYACGRDARGPRNDCAADARRLEPGAPTALLDAFEAHWRGDLCSDSMEEEQLHEQGLQMLRDYWGDQAPREVAVVATDRRLEGLIGGQAFVAVADVLLREAQGPLEVTRFVTSRRPQSEEHLRQDLSAQLLWLLAHESLEGPLRVVFYALRKREVREVVLSEEEATAARQDLAARADRLYREVDFEPIKGEYCRWCRVRNRCPLWRT